MAGEYIIAVVLVALTLTGVARGQVVSVQGSNPSAPFQSRLTLQGSGKNSAFTVHRDALNRPCLDIEAAARRHVINPNVFDHVVSVYNNCLMPIKLRVCYYNTDHCIDMKVRGKQRKDGILGIFPNMRYFRYSYREQF